jgi:hypothetical protein
VGSFKTLRRVKEWIISIEVQAITVIDTIRDKTPELSLASKTKLGNCVYSRYCGSLAARHFYSEVLSTGQSSSLD